MTTIAVAGKGGVGKTTCAALLVRALAAAGAAPILAVDADPQANLHLLLGLPAPLSIGSLREEILAEGPGGTPRGEILEARVLRSVVEGEAVDLVAMGRGEGPGCYCYVNSLLRQTLLRLSSGYRAVVVDNEAGMEHLSRRTLRSIDHLLLVADPSPRGLSAARGIAALAAELSLPVGRTWLLVNRPYAGGGSRAVEFPGIPVLADIPFDPSLPAWESSGRSLLDLPGGGAACQAVAQAAATLFPGRGR